MGLTKDDRVTEKIALLLLRLPEEKRTQVSHTALDMANRAERGWWELVGSPYYNAQLASLREKIDERR